MCGGYALHGPQSRLREAFLLESPLEYFARYNIAPQSRVPGQPGDQPRRRRGAGVHRACNGVIIDAEGP